MYTKNFTDSIERVLNGSSFVEEMKTLGTYERIRNLYRVRNKKGEIAFFTPKPEQDKFLREKTGRDLILKSRQIGFTTLACLYGLDKAIWDGWNCGIMSHIRERTGIIFEIVKRAFEQFQKDWAHLIKIEADQNNANTLAFKEGKIMVSYDFRGLTLNFLHGSEASFCQPERLVASIQSVPEHGEVVLETTANGCGGFFYDQWQLFKREGSCAPYKGHFYPWFETYPEDLKRWSNIELKLNPEEIELMERFNLKKEHLAWRRWKINEGCGGDEAQFNVEYPTDDVSCFLSGSDQVFPLSILKYQEKYVSEPSYLGSVIEENRVYKFEEDKKGLLRVWEGPKTSNTYTMGVDVSEGVNRDYSVITVLCRETGRQVAGLRAQIPTEELASLAYKIAKWYNGAYICCEYNNLGQGVIKDLKERGYSRFYMGEDGRDGFYTSITSKPELTDKFRFACKTGAFRLKDEELLKEMTTFIQVSNKLGRGMKREARPGCNDDYVMSACFAYWMHYSLGELTKDEDLPTPQYNDMGFYIGSDYVDRSDGFF